MVKKTSTIKRNRLGLEKESNQHCGPFYCELATQIRCRPGECWEMHKFALQRVVQPMIMPRIRGFYLILCLCGGVLTPRLCLSGVKLVNPTWSLDFVSDAIAKPGAVSRVS